MAKPKQDPKPAGPVRRAARTVARQVNVRAAARQLRQTVDEVAPREQPEGEQRAELVRVVAPTPGPACLARLGAGLGFAGVVAVTVAAAFVGVLDAGLDTVRPSSTPSATDLAVSATCVEPASWCGGASR
jgi:hypothetical protein